MMGGVRSKTLANRISEICICSLKKIERKIFIFCEEMLLIRKKVETAFDTFLTKITQIPSVAHRRSFPENHHMYGCRRIPQSSSMIIKSEKMNVSERVDIIRTKKNWDRVPRKKVVTILSFGFFSKFATFCKILAPKYPDCPRPGSTVFRWCSELLQIPKICWYILWQRDLQTEGSPDIFTWAMPSYNQTVLPIFFIFDEINFSTLLRGFFMPGGLWDRRILGAPRARCA